MAGLFETLLVAGVGLAKAAYEDSQVKKYKETDEYQDELDDNIQELKQKSDIELLYDFHKEYDDNWGRGLFSLDNSNRMDPLFMAYMKVFQQRNIKKMEVRCRECNRRLGYRMVPMDLSKVREEYELTHGFCDCTCGASKSWEVCQSYGGDIYISVGSF